MGKMTEVLFYKSKLFFPLSFSVHTWIVIEDNGNKERWELWQIPKLKIKKKSFKSFGRVYKNLQPCEIGINRWPYGKLGGLVRNKAIVFAKLNGKEAITIKNFLEIFSGDYKFRDRYHYWPGPNSNTFIQWVIDRTRTNIKLPWNAFGKDYRRSENE